MIDNTKHTRIFPITKLNLRDVILKNNLPLIMDIYTVALRKQRLEYQIFSCAAGFPVDRGGY
jgi:hypothetical protein